MSIQKICYEKSMNLGDLKFKLDFYPNGYLDNITNECNRTFNEVLQYNNKEILDKFNNNIVTVLEKNIGNILYRIVLKEKSFTFYSYMITEDDVKEVLKELKKVVSLFLDFVHKLQNSDPIISNVLFTKNIKTTDMELIERYEKDNNVIVDNNVGLRIICDKRTRNNILLYSYFIKQIDIKNFMSNISDNIDRLYNITI